MSPQIDHAAKKVPQHGTVGPLGSRLDRFVSQDVGERTPGDRVGRLRPAFHDLADDLAALRSPRPVLADLPEGVRQLPTDYGNGTVAFSEATLRPVTSPFTPPPRELPVELDRPEIKFDGIGVRRAGDLGESGDPNVRYVLTWESLPPNHDRQRSGPLPPAAMLRVCKLARNAAPDGQ